MLNCIIPLDADKIFSIDKVQLNQVQNSQVIDNQIQNMRLKCIAVNKIILFELIIVKNDISRITEKA